VFAALARLKLGFWPSYGQPDPKDLDWSFLDVPALFWFLLAPVAVLVSVGLAFRRWFTGRPNWGTPLWTLGSFSVLVLWLWFDPGGFVVWWLD
jgi:hypothetical protein